jgi:hypothetical protein
MSDKFGWDFDGQEDAEAEIRAAVRYLLKGAAGTARAEIVREITQIVRDVVNGLPSGPPDPLDEDMPGG